MKRTSKYSLEQLYSFIKAKGAQVVTNFNHDPAKNANSVILKSGIGNTSDNAAGKVQGGSLYYYCAETGPKTPTWTKTDFTSTVQPGTPCLGIHTQNYLLGIALGTFGKYSGTPEEVGMLLRGVTTTRVILSSAKIGEPLYVSAVNGGSTFPAGSITNVQPTTTGNIVRLVGYSLANTPYDAGIGSKSVIFFQPTFDYSIAP